MLHWPDNQTEFPLCFTSLAPAEIRFTCADFFSGSWGIDRAPRVCMCTVAVQSTGELWRATEPAEEERAHVVTVNIRLFVSVVF